MVKANISGVLDQLIGAKKSRKIVMHQTGQIVYEVYVNCKSGDINVFMVMLQWLRNIERTSEEQGVRSVARRLTRRGKRPRRK